MKKFLICLFILCSITSSSYASYDEIYEIYTEATGNNQYEAKIKAIDRATQRAFTLLVNKIGISDENFNKIPRHELKSAFSSMEIRNENIRVYLSGSQYKAVLRFQFKQSAINSLIMNYGSDKTKDILLEALVFPIFKINSILELRKDKRKWINLWEKSRIELIENKIYYPDLSSPELKKFTAKDIISKDYDEYTDLIPYRLFKRVIIPIAEYFTDRSNGDTFLKIKYIIIDNDGRREIEERINLPTSKNDLSLSYNSIIDEFIKKHGRKSNLNIAEENNSEIQEFLKGDGVPKDNFYIFLMEVNYAKELDEIQKKLLKIKEIDRFSVSSHYELGYKLKIYTQLSMLELAEALYYGELSFYYNEFQNPVLINVRN